MSNVGAQLRLPKEDIEGLKLCAAGGRRWEGTIARLCDLFPFFSFTYNSPALLTHAPFLPFKPFKVISDYTFFGGMLLAKKAACGKFEPLSNNISENII